MPRGWSCSAYAIRMPHWLPSPSRRRNSGRSCGVEISMISRTPASISTRERVVDHRLVVDGQELLGDARASRDAAACRRRRRIRCPSSVLPFASAARRQSSRSRPAGRATSAPAGRAPTARHPPGRAATARRGRGRPRRGPVELRGGSQPPNLAGHLGAGLARAEAVRDSRRDVELVAFGGVQADRKVPPMASGGAAEVHHDVQDGAAQHPHQLRLRPRRELEMQAATVLSRLERHSLSWTNSSAMPSAAKSRWL